MSGFLAFFKRKPPYGAGKDAVGRYGEKQCRRYLRKQGCRIVARNYRGSHGEIDVIARSRDTLLFTEVKTRKFYPDSPFGTPQEAVDAEKRSHILRTAKEYLGKHPTSLAVRFDICEVYLYPDRADIHYIKGAFHP